MQLATGRHRRSTCVFGDRDRETEIEVELEVEIVIEVEIAIRTETYRGRNIPAL